MRKIIKYSFFQIFIKLKRFLLEILMMLIAFIILQYALINNYSSQLFEKTTANLLAHKSEDVYTLNLDLYIQNFPTLEDQENLVDFFSDLLSIEGIEQSGEFWFFPKGELNEYNDLYINTTLIGLCDGMEDAQLAITEQLGIDDLCPVVVGRELENEFPVDTVFHNNDYDIDCKVVHVLNENSEWIAPKNSDLLSISMTDCIIYPVEYFYGIHPYFSCNGLNDSYIVVDSDFNIEDAIGQIHQVAQDNEIILNDIISMNEYFRVQVMNRRDSVGELVIMPIILLIISIATIALVCIISLKRNIRNMGIMLSNGMTRLEIVAMYFVENAVKLNISFWLAYLYWYFNIKNIYNMMFFALKDITFIMIICLIILVLMLNLVPYVALKRSKPIEMIGREC